MTLRSTCAATVWSSWLLRQDISQGKSLLNKALVLTAPTARQHTASR